LDLQIATENHQNIIIDRNKLLDSIVRWIFCTLEEDIR